MGGHVQHLRLADRLAGSGCGGQFHHVRAAVRAADEILAVINAGFVAQHAATSSGLSTGAPEHMHLARAMLPHRGDNYIVKM
jgi:hypothetical protein